MDYILVAFSSRTDAMRFKETAISRGISSAVTATPKGAGVGCGLSVKVFSASAETVLSLLRRLAPISVLGVFIVNIRGGHSFIRPLAK